MQTRTEIIEKIKNGTYSLSDVVQHDYSIVHKIIDENGEKLIVDDETVHVAFPMFEGILDLDNIHLKDNAKELFDKLIEANTHQLNKIYDYTNPMIY